MDEQIRVFETSETVENSAQIQAKILHSIIASMDSTYQALDINNNNSVNTIN